MNNPVNQARLRQLAESVRHEINSRGGASYSMQEFYELAGRPDHLPQIIESLGREYGLTAAYQDRRRIVSFSLAGQGVRRPANRLRSREVNHNWFDS